MSWRSALRRVAMILIAALGVLAVVYLVQVERVRPAPGPRVPSPAHVPAERATGEEEGARVPGETPGPIRIGWTAWADAEIVTHLAARVLEERMGYDVELVMADIGIQYQGVATGELDVMLMAWLPVTHQNYWSRVAGSVVNLGPLYTGARLGWVVPQYVPREELESMRDLRRESVRRRLRGRIQGIDPGSGLMQASEEALRAYDLEDFQLVSASDAAMTAALGRAIRRNEWIVVTGWSPHWMFAEWDLRYLEDPEGALGGKERIHALVRRDFHQDYPTEVIDMLTRMYLPLEELQAAMLEANRSSVDNAVEEYIETHPDRIEYWVTGKVD